MPSLFWNLILSDERVIGSKIASCCDKSGSISRAPGCPSGSALAVFPLMDEAKKKKRAGWQASLVTFILSVRKAST